MESGSDVASPEGILMFRRGDPDRIVASVETHGWWWMFCSNWFRIGVHYCIDHRRVVLARQLWFWHGRDTDPEHDSAFRGQTTHSEEDWTDLLTDSERDEWLRRAREVMSITRRITRSLDSITTLIGRCRT